MEIALLALALALGAVAWSMLRRDRRRTLGRAALLESIEKSAEGAMACTDSVEMGERVLRPLTRSFSPADGDLALWTLDPPREAKVEGHAAVRFRPVEIPVDLLRVLFTPEGPLRTVDLEGRVVREPAMRSVLTLLRERGVALFVPCFADGEAQGALLVPTALGGLPIDEGVCVAFEQAARWIAPALAHAGARARSADREAAWVSERKELRAMLDRERARAREATFRTRPTFVARSAAMRTLLGEIEAAAEGRHPILLEAAAGAGAGRVARAIHAASAWSEGVFLERAAHRLRASDLRTDGVAAGGMLLVRDLVNLPDALVEPLLTAITEHAFGLVWTTRCNVEDLVTEGRVDSRVWEALRAHRIRVPALAERREDLAELAALRLREHAGALARPELHLSPRAIERIVAHSWPGNVPELDLVIADAAARAKGPRIEAEELRIGGVGGGKKRAAEVN